MLNVGVPQSNAAKGKDAVEKSKTAVDASKMTSTGDHEAHQRAAQAHRDAAWAHRDAGNGTVAEKHQAQARVHDEKADAGYRAKSFADGEGRAAEEISKKADMKQFGDKSGPQDPRKEHELHADAAQAHGRAAEAFKLAGCDAEAQYHAAKADAHVGAHNATKPSGG